jgi:uncharacterized OB-fold protein
MSKRILFHPGALEEKNGGWVQMGNRCNACGKTSYPPVERCPFCASEQVEKVPLSGVGTVFSFSLPRIPVGPYKPPILTCYVDLPEGTRLFGQLHGHGERVRTGMKVKTETGVIWTEKDGTEVIGYYFVPCEEEDGGAQS